jgi:hypothetical protein
MRLVTSARLRAIGLLMIEAAGLALLIYDRVSGDKQVRKAAEKLLTKASSL